jgi:malonate transporter and related proteins
VECAPGITAAGMTKEVAFEPIDGPINDLIDNAYRAKYRGSRLIGAGAGGITLFLTALILSSQPLRVDANVTAGTLLKHPVHPLLAAAPAAALATPPLIGRETILVCAVPSGFFGILFGLRYGVVSQGAGSTLVASSLLSAASLPVAIYWVST